MEELEFYFEKNYVGFEEISSGRKIAEMRSEISKLLLSHGIGTKKELIDRLVLYRNHLFLSPTLSLRVLQDLKTLKVAKVDEKVQASVCWWLGGCTRGSGSNSYLLCGKHGQLFEEEDVQDVLCTGGWSASATIEDPDGMDLKQELKIRARCIECISALADHLNMDSAAFNPLHLDTEQRHGFQVELSGKRFVSGQTAFTFDSEKLCFLCMDLSADGRREWKAICNERDCYAPAFESYHHLCSAHIFAKEGDWKLLVCRKILELAGVTDLEKINVNVRMRIIEAINNGNGSNIIVPKCLRLSKTMDDTIGCIYKKGRYVLCENFDESCGNVYQFKINNACPKCDYLKTYAAFLIRIPHNSLADDHVFVAMWISFIDPDFLLLTESKIKRLLMTRIKSLFKGKPLLSNYRIQDFVVLEREECGDGGLPCAIAWTAGMYLYCLLISTIIGRKIKLAHKIARIGPGMWKAVNMLALRRGFSVRPARESVQVTTPYGYELYDPEVHTLSSQDFRSTTYEIRAMHLAYVGEKTISAAKGRGNLEYSRNHNAAIDRTRCNRLVDSLVSLGVDVEYDRLPSRTITVNTRTEMSQFLPETMVILARTVHEQLLGRCDLFVTNRQVSTLDLEPTWFAELQYLTMGLSGQTVAIVGAESITVENCGLFSTPEPMETESDDD